MMNLFIFFSFYLYVILPLHESMRSYSKKIQKIAEIDEEIGKESDLICERINGAMNLNKSLKVLYSQCPSAVTPSQILTLKTEGLLIENEQKNLLLSVQEKLMLLSTDFKTEFQSPFRITRGPCDLPGLLFFKSKKIFFLQRNFKNENGGAVGLDTLHNQIRWHFEDKRVREL